MENRIAGVVSEEHIWMPVWKSVFMPIAGLCLSSTFMMSVLLLDFSKCHEAEDGMLSYVSREHTLLKTGHVCLDLFAMQDLGFAILPELGQQNEWVSETIFSSMLISFIVWTFSPFWQESGKRFYTAVLYARVLTVLVSKSINLQVHLFWLQRRVLWVAYYLKKPLLQHWFLWQISLLWLLQYSTSQLNNVDMIVVWKIMS